VWHRKYLLEFPENIVKYIKHISKQEIYFTERKINMHVYFIYKLISYQAF